MRLSLNKNSLKQQRDHLQLYKRFLPSLDLKRQQLLGAWKQSRLRLVAAEHEIELYQKSLDQMLPLLGSSTLRTRDLSALVHVSAVALEEENVVGTRVPVVGRIQFVRAEYSTLTLPFWVDQLVACLEDLARLRIEQQVLQRRADRLGAAAKKITQRVNLFEKVLIPTANDNIKRIRVAMSDEDRAAVVRSKLAKRKRVDRVQ